VLASSAIPVVFPRVKAERDDWFFDGGVRLNTPISPAIDVLTQMWPSDPPDCPNRMVIVSSEPDPDTSAPSARATVVPGDPTIVDEMAAIMYSMFVDRVTEDVLSLRRVNALVGPGRKVVDPRPRKAGAVFESIQHAYFGPNSRSDIAYAASRAFQGMRISVRARCRLDTLSRALGNRGPSHDEILSFLLFDRGYLKELFKMGQTRANELLQPHRKVNWIT
jgi:NTE family protein